MKRLLIIFILLTGIILGLYLSFREIKTASAAWYATEGWAFRKKLTIDYTKVSGGANLTSFPVLVKLTDSNLRSAQSTGNDILFTSSDGSTKLDHEIEKFTQSTGELVAWVRIPTLSASANTVIYIYYGNPGAANQQNKTGVWDASYVGVWHLNETSGHHKDSTGKQADSTIEDETNRGTTGVVNGSVEFTKINGKYISIPNSTDLGFSSTDISMEMWVKPTTITNNQRVIRKCSDSGCGTDYESTRPYDVVFNSSNELYLKVNRSGSANDYVKTTALSAGQWTYFAAVIANDGTGAIGYTNGTQSSTDSATGAIDTSTQPLYFGDSGDWDPYDGILDEIRFSKTIRSAGWITTTYNTINSPSTFFSSGGQEKAREPVLYFKFDQGYGTTTTDSSPAKIVGTFAGAVNKPTWQTEDLCVSGKCLFFEGSNANLTVANTISNVQSVSFWEKTASSSGTIPLLKLTSSANISIVNGTTVTATGFNSPTVYVNGLPGTAVLPNVWNHIEVTDTAGTSANAIVLGTINSVTFFKGFLDEVKLFDTQRTADQVKADYNSKSSATARGASVIMGAQTTDALNKGLVGYWKMDEATWSGTLAEVKDSSGNSNDGQAQGATGGKAYPTSAKFGNGGYFDGIDDYVSLANAVNFSTATNWTVSGWFKRTGTASVIQSLVSNDYNNNTFGLNLSSSTLTWESGSAGWGRVIGPVLPTSWTYVTALFSGTSENWSVSWYLDGIFQSTTASTVAFSTPQIRYFGGWGAGGGAVINMDEVRIYNRALSPAEIGQLYNFAPGPIAYWKMEEGSGTTTSDSSGNGFNGTWAGTGTPHYVTGKYGKAGNFNGTDDWVYNNAIGNSLNLISATPPSFTMEGWFFMKNSENLLSLVCDGTGATCAGTNNPANNNRVRLGQSGGSLFFQLKAGSTAVLSSASRSLNKWYHIVGTYDSTANLIKLYINGVYQNSATPVDTNLSGTTMRLGIGQAQGWFNGSIDDVRIYNYARTPEQILQDMGGGHPAQNNKTVVAYYKFDEGYGSTAKNSGVGSPDLTFGATTQAPSWSNSGKLGKALIFTSASSQYLYTANVALMAANTATYNSVSWGGWFNPTTAVDTRTLVHKGNEFKLTTGADSKANCAIYSSSWQTAAISTSALPLNTWSYVLCTYDGVNIKVYINGKQSGSSVTQTGLITSINSTPLNVGREPSTNYYNGLIDEVKIYGYALTSDDVLLDYNRGASTVLGSLSDTSGLSGGSIASQSASAEYCIPGDTTSCASPVGEWKIDEKKGTVANDSSGTGNSTTVVGGTAPTWSQGKMGSALDFKGVGCLTAPASASLDFEGTQNWSFSVWTYPRLTGGGATGPSVFWKERYVSGTDRGGYGLSIANTGTVAFTILNNGVTSVTTTVSANQWVHLEGTYDGSDMRIYKNGVLMNTTHNTTGMGTHPVDSFAFSGPGANRYYNGITDNLRIYNYARSAAQIAWDYNRGGPVARYKFDECTGTVANDSGGLGTVGGIGGNPGTISIGATLPQTQTGTCTDNLATSAWYNGKNGKFNSSLSFDGVDDYVQINDTANLDANLSQFSASFWVKLTTNTGWIDIVSKKANNDSDFSYGFYIPNDSKLRFQLKSSTDGNTLTADSTFPTGSWVHVVGTWNNSEIKMYLNGVRQSVGTTRAVTGTAVKDTAYNLVFGAASDLGNYMKGLLDDVRIYNYALTSTQIKTVMNENSAVRFAPLTGSP